MELFLIFLIIFISFLMIFVISMIFLLKKNLSFECNHIKKIREPKLEKNKIIFRDGYESIYKKNISASSKNIFILFHGLFSSSDDLKLIQKFLKNINESVINLDQRNWGKNKISNCYHLGTLRDDYYELLELIKKKYSDKKIILIGHSMGTLVLSLLLKKYKNLDKNIDFILINYPSKYFVNSKSFVLKKKNFFYFFLNGIIFNKKITFKYLDYNSKKHLIKNKLKENKGFYVIKKFPFYFFLNIICSMFFLKQNISFEVKNKVLIFLGSKDEFTDWKIIEKHKKFFEKKHKKNIKLIIIEDMEHIFAKDMKNVNIFFKFIYEEFKKLN